MIDLFRTVFVLTTDAVNHWSSRLSVDKRRFEWEGRDSLDVNGDDPMFVDHPKGPDTVLVDAQRWDVDAGKEGCSTRVLAWEAHVLELLA